MKKFFYILISAIVIIILSYVLCNSPSEKLETAKNNVDQANIDLANAKQEYLEDMQSFKDKTADRIAENEKTIAEFKAKLSKEKKSAKASYNKKIAELEQKNRDMKKSIDEYKAEGKENWEKFKSEFSHDMDALGKAFKDLTVNNVK